MFWQRHLASHRVIEWWWCSLKAWSVAGEFCFWSLSLSCLACSLEIILVFFLTLFLLLFFILSAAVAKRCCWKWCKKNPCSHSHWWPWCFRWVKHWLCGDSWEGPVKFTWERYWCTNCIWWWSHVCYNGSLWGMLVNSVLSWGEECLWCFSFYGLFLYESVFFSSRSIFCYLFSIETQHLHDIFTPLGA